MERKEQNERAAERRVNRVFKALRAWGDLSAARYGFEGPAVNAMHVAILNRLDSERSRFHEQRTFCFSGGDADEREGASSDSEDGPTE